MARMQKHNATEVGSKKRRHSGNREDVKDAIAELVIFKADELGKRNRAGGTRTHNQRIMSPLL